MELHQIASDLADVLVAIDTAKVPFKQFQAGVGPYGEPQLLKLVSGRLNLLPAYGGLVVTRRTPDLLVRGKWALEFKIVRPFGDNGKQAENWSVNLLHPYEGNVSIIGDCLKLLPLPGPERKAAVVIGYEHDPPRISLEPLMKAFEVLAERVAGIDLGPRIHAVRRSLVHPVHQQLSVVAWEVRGRKLNDEG